jgi:hypothetical protein
MILAVASHASRIESVCPRALPRNKTELRFRFEEHKQFSERLMSGVEDFIACSFQFLFQHLTHENENTDGASALNGTPVRAFNQTENISKLTQALTLLTYIRGVPAS